MRARHTQARTDDERDQGTAADVAQARAQIRELAGSWFPGLAPDVLDRVVETAWDDVCDKRAAAEATSTETLVTAGAAAVRRVGLRALRGELDEPPPPEPTTIAPAPAVVQLPSAPPPPAYEPPVRRPAAPAHDRPASTPPRLRPPTDVPHTAPATPALSASSAAVAEQQEPALYPPSRFDGPPPADPECDRLAPDDAIARPAPRPAGRPQRRPGPSRALLRTILGALLALALLLALVLPSDPPQASPGQLTDMTLTARTALERVELAAFASLSDRIAASERRRLAADRRTDARRQRAARRRAAAAARRARERRAARRGAVPAPVPPPRVAPRRQFAPVPPPPPPARRKCAQQDDFCF